MLQRPTLTRESAVGYTNMEIFPTEGMEELRRHLYLGSLTSVVSVYANLNVTVVI